MILNENINKEFKALRKAHKLPLRVISEKTGLSISFLSEIERGKVAPSLESMVKIADAYNMDIHLSFVYRGVAGND